MGHPFLISAFLLSAVCATTVAQITITVADVQTTWTVGFSAATNLDTVAGSINIGQLGSTSWNFAVLASHMSFTTTQVNPASTPYAANFPGATHARYSNGTVPGIPSESWGYASLTSTSALFHGGVSVVTYVPGFPFTTYQTFAPHEIELQLPLTFNTSWQYNGIETAISLRPPLPADTVTTTLNVVETADAYGPMTMPGGSVANALRLRRDERRTSSQGGNSRHISYIFLTRTGESVVVETNDTVSTTGVIQVEGVTWIRQPMPYVEGGQGKPVEFALDQNFPNPFNPRTSIRFAIAERGKVTLAVFDVVGREVASLVKEVRALGLYEVEWDASNMTSGVYFCRLATANFIKTRKLVLLR